MSRRRTAAGFLVASAVAFAPATPAEEPTLAEGLTESVHGHDMKVEHRIFTAPNFGEYCRNAGAVTSVELTQEPLALAVGRRFPLSQLRAVARDGRGIPISRVPIHIDADAGEPPRLLMRSDDLGLERGFVLAIHTGTVRFRARAVCTPQVVSEWRTAEIEPAAPASYRLRDAARRLRQIPVDDASAGGWLPPEARPWLKEMKAELAAIVSASVRDLPLGEGAPDVARERILGALVEQEVIPWNPPGDDELGWGHVDEVAAWRVPRFENLLALRIQLSVPCGSDGALSLFRHDGSRWTRVLVEEARDFDDISGALGTLKFAVTPPAEDGSFHVLVADIPPWCSSVWHPLRYRVRTVVPGAAEPIERLVDATEPIAEDEGYALEANADGFLLTFSAWDDENPGMRVRERIRLRVLDGKVSQARSRVTGRSSK